LVTETSNGWLLVAAEPSYECFDARADGLPLGKPIGSCARPSTLLSSAKKLCDRDVDLIAVDMPIARVPIVGRRRADDEVSGRYGAYGCGTHSPNITRPGRISSELSEGFAEAGYGLLTASKAKPPGLIEVYPHPALIELTGAEWRLPYKVGKMKAYWAWATPQQRRDLLFREWSGIVTLLEREISGVEAALPLPAHEARRAELKAYEDALDAVICAWVAVCALEGRAVPFGDQSSAIWIPKR
jgi:predicted RNase H-like nuclease